MMRALLLGMGLAFGLYVSMDLLSYITFGGASGDVVGVVAVAESGHEAIDGVQVADAEPRAVPAGAEI